MGVVVRRYIDILTIIINFPYSTCISSFLAAASLLLCSFLNVFSVLYIMFELFKVSIHNPLHPSMQQAFLSLFSNNVG